MNNQIVTTGLVPLAIGSQETFQLQARKDGLPWDLTGGQVSLLLAGPAGTITTYPCTISGGCALFTWTVTGPAGNWTLAWSITDETGLKQVSRPVPFVVQSSPV